MNWDEQGSEILFLGKEGMGYWMRSDIRGAEVKKRMKAVGREKSKQFLKWGGFKFQVVLFVFCYKNDRVGLRILYFLLVISINNKDERF